MTMDRKQIAKLITKNVLERVAKASSAKAPAPDPRMLMSTIVPGGVPDSSDPLLAYMKKRGIAVTRAYCLALNDPEGAPDPFPAELEATDFATNSFEEAMDSWTSRIGPQPEYDFTPTPGGAKTFTQIFLDGVHNGALPMLAAQELQTLGGWHQLRSVDPEIWSQLCRYILTNAPQRGVVSTRQGEGSRHEHFKVPE